MLYIFKLLSVLGLYSSYVMANSVNEIQSFENNPFEEKIAEYTKLETVMSDKKYKQFMQSDEVVETFAMRDLFDYCRDGERAFWIVAGEASIKFGKGKSKDEILGSYAKKIDAEYPFVERFEAEDNISQFIILLGWSAKDKDLHNTAEIEKFYYHQCLSQPIEQLKYEYEDIEYQ